MQTRRKQFGPIIWGYKSNPYIGFRYVSGDEIHQQTLSLYRSSATWHLYRFRNRITRRGFMTSDMHCSEQELAETCGRVWPWPKVTDARPSP